MKQQGIKLDRSPEHWTGKNDGLVAQIEEHTGVTVLRETNSNEAEFRSRDAAIRKASPGSKYTVIFVGAFVFVVFLFVAFGFLSMLSSF